MIYLLLAILLLIVVGLLYRKFVNSFDKREFIKASFLVMSVLFFTYISRVIMIHKPTLILHLALLIVSYYGLFLYLLKDRLNYFLILMPSISTLFFIFMALFFKENG